jgi:hypothetical protein
MNSNRQAGWSLGLGQKDSHMIYNIGHPQMQRMVSCKLCEKCYYVNFGRLLHFLRIKVERQFTSSFTSQAHVSQCKNQGMDDELPI